MFGAVCLMPRCVEDFEIVIRRTCILIRCRGTTRTDLKPGCLTTGREKSIFRRSERITLAFWTLFVLEDDQESSFRSDISNFSRQSPSLNKETRLDLFCDFKRLVERLKTPSLLLKDKVTC